MKPPYPKLPFKLNHARKLSGEDIKRIKKDRKEGVLLRVLAKKYKVSKSAIVYWTNKKSRQNTIKLAAERTHRLWFGDRKYRIKKRDIELQSLNRRKKEFKPQRDYFSEMAKFIRNRNGLLIKS